MKISIGAAMALAILFTGMILCSCTSDGSHLPMKEFVVTDTGYYSYTSSLAIVIPKTGDGSYKGSYDGKQSLNYQSLITIPGHSITDGEFSNGGISVTVSPPLDPANPNDAIVFFNTDLIFYEITTSVFGGTAVAARCRIITPSFAIKY